jgi:excinuclease ABC subunit C
MFDSKALIRSLPEEPGVYRMLDGEGRVLYVGKAKALKRRVASYFQKPTSARASASWWGRWPASR